MADRNDIIAALETPNIPAFEPNTGPIDFGTVRLPTAVTFTNYDEYLRGLRCIASDLVRTYVDDHRSLFLEATLRYMMAVGCPDTPANRRTVCGACVNTWVGKMTETTAVQLRRSAIRGPSRSET